MDLQGHLHCAEVSIFLLFLKDCSRISWVYSMKERSEAFKKSIERKAMVEKMSMCPLNILRTDRGRKFLRNLKNIARTLD